MRQRTRTLVAGDGGGLRSVAGLETVLAVLSSTLVSVAGHEALSNTMRIHWSLGAGPYYGPEFAPTILVLGLFPALVGLLSVGGAWLAARLPLESKPPGARLAYAAGVTSLVLVMLGVQVGLVVANL